MSGELYHHKDFAKHLTLRAYGRKAESRNKS
jgi:hypothetical protein